MYNSSRHEGESGSVPGPVGAGLIAFVALAWLAWAPLPYEQDQIAKAAKIISLERTGHLFAPLAGPNYYRDEMFSFYYMAHTWLHALWNGDVFREMNLAAAFMGAVFCALVAAVLRRVFSIPPWLTALLAVNTPLFLFVFSFGNETAMALAAFACAWWLLTRPARINSVLAGIVFGLSLHCRPDALLLAPFLCAWLWWRTESGRRWSAIIRCIWFVFSALATGILYWLAFVRRAPSETSFEVHFSSALFAAFLIFPFAPALMPAAAAGVWRLLRQRTWIALSLVLLFIPLIYYARMLTSPKYIAVLMVPLWVAAGAGLQSGGKWLRVTTVLLAAFFWLCSISPFGFFAGARGAMWFLPSADGPLPTGSYAWFYANARAGMYQERYEHEIEQAGRLLKCLAERPDAALTGYFNPQSATYALARQGRYQETADDLPWQITPVPANRPCVLIETSYLRLNTFDPASQEILRAWFAEGRVRALRDNEQGLFPAVIETGAHIETGANADLGRRILFALDLSRSVGYGQRSRFVADWVATRWLPVGEVVSDATHSPAYEDASFVCYTNDVGRGVIYSCVMPLEYYGIKDPRPYLHKRQ